MPGVTLVSFGGISVPAGTQEPVVKRLNAAIHEALARKEVRDRLIAAGSVRVEATTPEAFAEDFRAEIARTGRMMELVGLQAQ